MTTDKAAAAAAAETEKKAALAPSRADRLDALVRRAAPKTADYLAKHGTWPRQASGAATAFDEDPAASVAKLTKRISTAEPDTPMPAVEARAVAADRSKRAAPYVIDTLPDNGRRVRLTGDDGDVRSGVGATLDAAIADLEAKVS